MRIHNTEDKKPSFYALDLLLTLPEELLPPSSIIMSRVAGCCLPLSIFKLLLWWVGKKEVAEENNNNIKVLTQPLF
jgi:hypothetical protein